MVFYSFFKHRSRRDIGEILLFSGMKKQRLILCVDNWALEWNGMWNPRPFVGKRYSWFRFWAVCRRSTLSSFKRVIFCYPPEIGVSNKTNQWKEILTIRKSVNNPCQKAIEALILLAVSEETFRENWTSDLLIPFSKNIGKSRF